MQDIETYLCGYIGEEILGEAAVAADDELLLSGRLDSLMVVRLVVHIEERYGLTIPPTDVILQNVQTAGALAAYLRETHGLEPETTLEVRQG